MNPLLELHEVSKSYHMGEVEVKALCDVNLRIMQGDFLAIVGASGSGKSTMMNLIGCLDVPTSGTIRLKGREITSMAESDLANLRGQTIGFIFQQYNLIATLTALENVMLPLEFLEYSDAAAKERAMSLLQKVELGDKTRNRPTQLSGGQQQRVAIARALASDPEIILADEPTGNLDSKTGSMVLAFLQKLNKEGKTVIMVTHDLHLAQHAHTLIELKDGRIVKQRKR